jgi:Zn-dependent oligopeptidase
VWKSISDLGFEPQQWGQRRVDGVGRQQFDFHAGFEKDPFDAKAGRRYRDLVLAPGGVGKILDHLTKFLGRPPSQEAFLKSRGIA